MFTKRRKTAVIEDLDGFMAWLATMPLITAASNKTADLGRAPPAAKPGPSAADKEFLEALKSMA
jgi:hypothetical protein